jgi:hypothetical protein
LADFAALDPVRSVSAMSQSETPSWMKQHPKLKRSAPLKHISSHRTSKGLSFSELLE